MAPYRYCILFLSGLIGLGAIIYAGTGTLFFVSMVDAVQDDDHGIGSSSLARLGVLRSADLKELSGIARSNIYPSSFWCHNDSGHSPYIYLVRHDGQVLAECEIAGAQNADWEDISSFEYRGVPYLAIGDVGDNRRRRANVAVYLLREPNINLKPKKRVKSIAKPLHKILLKYDDGPRDCEAIGVAGETGELWLMEKKRQELKSKSAGVYRLDLTPWLSGDGGKKNKGATKLRRVAEFPVHNITAMAFSRDAQKMIVRDYLAGHLLTLESDKDWIVRLRRNDSKLIALPLERQGEAICFDADGTSVIMTSEFQRQPIWQVRLEVAAEKQAER